MKRINVMVDDETLATLDRIARQTGSDNRSAAIRMLAREYASGERGEAMETVMSQAEIERLNARAIEIGGEPYEALMQVISEEELEPVTETEGRQTVVYRAHDGRLVNCWVEGVQSDQIEDGGLGFDDQIDLCRDDEDNDA